MIKSTVYDCKVLPLLKIHNLAGNITIIEGKKDVPFEIQRIYYLYDIPGGEERGGHAHKELHQLVVAASGSFDVLLDDGNDKRIINLNRPNFGLYILPGMWRELNNFSSGAICLVLASTKYNKSDYIRSYPEFLEFNNVK